MKKILVINTGGTISSIKTPKGYEPLQGFVQEAMGKISNLQHPTMPAYTIKEYDPLLDSSNMTPMEWNQIADDIYQNYKAYDGFVVFHGTDTMAYTASALSFMLENIAKPVILTGSQIPLSEVRNDALDNIVTSLWLAAHAPIQEVCIYFNQTLLRGNRAEKISARRLNAFDSPNFPHLASIGTDIQIQEDLLIKAAKGPFTLQKLTPHYIANFRLFPGFATEVLDFICKQPLQGLILETYGAGNAPNQDKVFLSLLRNATEKGIIIINCTQCQHGGVEMQQYATGSSLKEAGVVSGHDMTPEAAHCKLLYLLSKGIPIPMIKLSLEMNLCGELSSLSVAL